ncbi:MAG TPA: ABC transporter permease [Candidatus Didemnitutus sp.]|nr:ABC transporter permease [Candidatus Didemnitutus sp.]
MNALRQFWFRLVALFRRRNWEAEMAEEMRQHLDQRADELVAEGMAPEEARYAAQRAFGGLLQIQESCRDERRLPMLESLSRDVRFAVRALGKNPGFTATAVLTLALGIGAGTALFSTFNTFVLHPLTLPQSNRLVRIWVTNPALSYNSRYLSWPRYEFIRDHQKSFSDVAAANFAGYSLMREGANPESLNALQVTANFLPTLGVTPWRGRNFTPEEDAVGGPDVAILSYECWQRYFGGRESIVGESIRLGGAPYAVVGILPPALSNPYGGVMVVVPRAFEPQDIATQIVRNGGGYLDVTARLKEGVALEQADAEVKALAQNYRAAFPMHTDGRHDGATKAFAEELVGNFKPTFYLVMVAVGLVMLIACANVASLFFARLSTRRKEIAVRLSLGATRGQLVRQFMAESLVFSAAAGVLGVIFAWWAIDLIRRIIVASIGNSGVAGFLETSQLPLGANLSVDGPTLAFTVGLATLTALIVGCVPALEASRAGVAEVLKDSVRSAAGGIRGARLRAGLIVGQVALSVVLLVGSALLLMSLARLQRTQPGFEPRGVATAYVSIADTGQRYATGRQQADFYGRLIERFEALPQVKSAAVGYDVPLIGFQASTTYVIGGQPVPPASERGRAWIDSISEHYFATMGIPLREGRIFDERDNDQAPNVCIVNESFAARLFPGESAVGKILLRGAMAEIKCRIVGVVGDVKSASLSEPAPDEIYLPIRQLPRSTGTLVVRTEGDPAALQTTLRSALAAVDDTVALTFFTTMDSALGSSLFFQRITAGLTGAFAGVALLLSAVGLYSVIAYTITQRMAEIGLRMALGARREQVVRLILRSGLRLVARGLLLGLGIAAGVGRLMTSLLYQVQPLDPFIYGGVAVLFALIAALACLLPALRASRIDPLVALHAE